MIADAREAFACIERLSLRVVFPDAEPERCRTGRAGADDAVVEQPLADAPAVQPRLDIETLQFERRRAGDASRRTRGRDVKVPLDRLVAGALGQQHDAARRRDLGALDVRREGVGEVRRHVALVILWPEHLVEHALRKLRKPFGVGRHGRPDYRFFHASYRILRVFTGFASSVGVMSASVTDRYSEYLPSLCDTPTGSLASARSRYATCEVFALQGASIFG